MQQKVLFSYTGNSILYIHGRNQEEQIQTPARYLLGIKLFFYGVDN